MKNTLYTLILFIGLMSSAPRVQAQADRIGNGGDWTEAELKHYLTRLSLYLGSPEGQVVFPEVVEYNLKHPEEKIEKIASEMNPRLVNHLVTDSKGNERDCVSYTTPIRYFECNLKSLPAKPLSEVKDEQKSAYYGSLYRLVLHEVFVQAELEKHLNREIPSEYAISSRLMVHLERFPEWVPGAARAESVSSSDISIHTKLEFSGSVGAGYGNYGRALSGVQLNAQLPLTVGSSDFKLGLSVAYTYAFGQPNAWVLPILATAEYDFPMIVGVRPYIRLGMGFSFARNTYTAWYRVNGVDQVQDYSETMQGGALSFVPGIMFGSHQQYFFEVPITSGNYAGATIMANIGMKF